MHQNIKENKTQKLRPRHHLKREKIRIRIRRSPKQYRPNKCNESRSTGIDTPSPQENINT